MLIDATIGAREAVKPFDTASTKGCIADSFSNGIIASALLPSANLAQCSLLNTPPVACPALPPDTLTLILESLLLKPKNSFTLSMALPILFLMVLHTSEHQLYKVLNVSEHQLENETSSNESNLLLQFVHQVLIFPAVFVTQSPIGVAVSVTQSPIEVAVSVAQSPIEEAVSVTQSPIEEAVSVTQSPIEEAVSVNHL